MGQKILPLSLRLNKKKNWYSNWIVSKKEYANFLFFDLEIRKYFENIFNEINLKITNLKINKSSKNIYIYVYIQKHPKSFFKDNIKKYNIIKNLNNLLDNKYNVKLFVVNTTLTIKNINKSISKIFNFFKKNNKINFKFKRILYGLIYSFYTFNFNLISNTIKNDLQNKKIHIGYIRFINNILKNFLKLYSNYFFGFRIQIKGRINGAKRSRKITFQEGQIPLNSLKSNVKYTFEEFNTKSGICSLKMWFFVKEFN